MTGTFKVVIGIAVGVTGIGAGAWGTIAAIGYTAQQVNAGDILAAGGSLLGTGLAVIGAIAVEEWKRVADRRERRTFLFSIFNDIRNELRGGSRVDATVDYLVIEEPAARRILEAQAKRLAYLDGLLQRAASVIASTDVHAIKSIHAVELRLRQATEAVDACLIEADGNRTAAEAKAFMLQMNASTDAALYELERILA